MTGQALISPRGKRRILLVVSSMQSGGAERIAAHLANYWAAQGHVVMLVPTFSGRGGCAYPLLEEVRLEYLADHVDGAVFGSAKLPRLRAFRRMVLDFEPDTVLSFLTHVNVATLLACWGLDRPIVVSERTYPPLYRIGRFWGAARRLLYRRATRVVMQTERGALWAKKFCPGARIAVIPNPVVFPLPRNDPILEPDTTVRQGRRLVLAAGRLGPEKGFDMLLEAFARVARKAPEWDLVILGEGDVRGTLEGKKASLGLVGRVFMPGFAGNPGDWYERAELFVLSSRYEGFPNVLLEAMAHGLPAVSFDCDTGPGNIIRHGEDGYLVPPAEGAEGLAAAIAKLVCEEEQRKRMGAKARDVRRRFSFERIARMWEKALGLA